ncbi:MAG: 50S ribosomal protein L11 methyltransferase [Eubacterium sp.]|nr:50S ribosomal protein L11 methyltransferase [Eubacterium sp.]
MTNAVEHDKWTEIKIHVPIKDIETAENIANMVVPYGIYVEDYSSLEQEVDEIAHIDLIEESLLKKSRNEGIIHIYINPDENPNEAVSFIKDRFDNIKLRDYKIEFDDCLTEDWQNNWKQYFHAMPIGKKLLIRPLWENDFNAQGRKILNIEPGLAFGTGSHPTTKLCLETLEDYVNESSTILDIGCGSGILSIAALLLGAKSALGVDIDSLAVKTAIKNAAENNFDENKIKFIQGNLSDKVSGKFSIVVANIVADIIIQFNSEVSDFLDDDSIYITGGIIENREDDVLFSFAQNGFEVVERRENNGWLVFALRKQRPIA